MLEEFGVLKRGLEEGETERDLLGKKLGGREEELEMVKGKLEKVGGEVGEWRGQVGVMKGKLDGLSGVQGEKGELEVEIEGWRRKNEVLEGRIRGVGAESRGLEEKVGVLEKKLVEAQDAKLQGELGLKTTQKKLETTVSQAEADKSKFSREIFDLNTATSDLKSLLAQRTSELDT